MFGKTEAKNNYNEDESGRVVHSTQETHRHQENNVDSVQPKAQRKVI